MEKRHPHPRETCGPYTPSLKMEAVSGIESRLEIPKQEPISNQDNHDTICCMGYDDEKNLAIATSTNGLRFKIPGRVSDASIPGAGAYGENVVGGCVCTGNGDIMMRFNPSFYCARKMEEGYDPTTAARLAQDRILEYETQWAGAILAMDDKQITGAACHGFHNWSYAVRTEDLQSAKIVTIDCHNSNSSITLTYYLTLILSIYMLTV